MRPSARRRNRGFTLIEVLLVLVILVILASLATVNILSAQRSAKLKEAKIQVELLDRVNWNGVRRPHPARLDGEGG